MKKFVKKIVSLLVIGAMTVTTAAAVYAETNDTEHRSTYAVNAGINYGSGAVNPNSIVLPDPSDGGFILPEYPAGSYYSTTGKECTCHKADFSCSSNCVCKYYCGAKQCMGFAFEVYDKKHSNECYTSAKTTWKTSSDRSISVDEAKSLFMNAPKGTYARVILRGGVEHSIAICNTTASNISIYHANYDGKCKVSYDILSWEEFNQRFPKLKEYLF